MNTVASSLSHLTLLHTSKLTSAIVLNSARPICDNKFSMSRVYIRGVYRKALTRARGNQNSKSLFFNNQKSKLVKCGGWGSNPRTPTRQGPKPCSFDHSDTPAQTRMCQINLRTLVNIFDVSFHASLIYFHKALKS